MATPAKINHTLLSLTYKIDVLVTANGGEWPTVLVSINGQKNLWSLKHASNHVVYYLAILSCLVEAIEQNAHHVHIEVGDQVVMRQLNGKQQAQQRHTAALLAAIKQTASQIKGSVTVT